VNTFAEKAGGFVTGLISDGPWRSKSVLAALVAVVVGLWFWFSDIKNPPPQNAANNPTTSAPSNTTTNPPDTSNQENYFVWTVKVHNKINSLLGKTEVSLIVAIARWQDNA